MATTYKLTKLAAVNIILSNIGQAPLNSLNTSNPLSSLAEGMIDEVSHSLQSEGWVFNTEQDYPLLPTIINLLKFQQTYYLQIKQNGLLQTYIRKPAGVTNQRLYDKRDHTYEFDGVQYLKVVWYFDFLDLPEVFKQYITIRAANLFANRAVGSNEVVKYSEKEEEQARAAVMEYETQQGDYNIFNDSAGGREFQTYLPYNAIKR